MYTFSVWVHQHVISEQNIHWLLTAVVRNQILNRDIEGHWKTGRQCRQVGEIRHGTHHMVAPGD